MNRKAPLGLAVAALMTLSVGACGGDDEPTAGSAPPSSSASGGPASGAPEDSPAEGAGGTASPEEPSPDAEKLPVKGDCLTEKDGATVVKCSEPHAYEVFYAKNDPTHLGDKKKRKAWENATCVTQGAAFFGNAGFQLSRLYAEPMRSPGEGRVACIAYEYRTTLGGYASNTSTLKGELKGDGFYDYNLCLKGQASKDKIELVTCSEPHAAEVIGGKLQGKPGDPFPKGGDKTIHAEARKYCKPLATKFLGGTRGDVAYAENSGSSGAWRDGYMTSACFVQTADGSTVTKSLKGIGDRPLSSYR